MSCLGTYYTFVRLNNAALASYGKKTTFHKITKKLLTFPNPLKRVSHEIFDFRLFSRISLSPGPWYPLGAILNFTKNRGDIHNFMFKLFTGVNDAVDIVLQVSLLTVIYYHCYRRYITNFHPFHNIFLPVTTTPEIFNRR
jgi:hypothetical protein